MSELGTASAGTPLREVLICAGLDPSGGAGLIADVRVVTALGARPVGVVTASTVQNTTGMRSSHPTETDVFESQLSALLSDVEVHAVKIGLLGAIEIARAIGEGLHLTAAPVVWDPIFGATLGGVSFDRAMFDEALRELAPHLTLITPNLDELRALAGSPIVTLADAVGAAKELVGRAGAAVLVKGGHFGGPDSIDVLVDATRVEELRGSRVPGGEHVHGTGCALSTAIATHLALGGELVEACRAAKAFVATRIASPVRPGRGAPAIV